MTHVRASAHTNRRLRLADPAHRAGRIAAALRPVIPESVAPSCDVSDERIRDLEERAATLAHALRCSSLGATCDLDPEHLQRLAEDTERLRRRIRDLNRTIGSDAAAPDAAALRRARACIFDARRSVRHLMSRLTDGRGPRDAPDPPEGAGTP